LNDQDVLLEVGVNPAKSQNFTAAEPGVERKRNASEGPVIHSKSAGHTNEVSNSKKPTSCPEQFPSAP
jgi:hypothetical protein